MSDKTMMMTTVITSLTALVGASTVFVKRLKGLKKAIVDLETALFHADNKNKELASQAAAKAAEPVAKKAPAAKKATPKNQN